jgi:hypothetical protein
LRLPKALNEVKGTREIVRRLDRQLDGDHDVNKYAKGYRAQDRGLLSRLPRHFHRIYTPVRRCTKRLKARLTSSFGAPGRLHGLGSDCINLSALFKVDLA